MRTVAVIFSLAGSLALVGCAANTAAVPDLMPAPAATPAGDYVLSEGDLKAVQTAVANTMKDPLSSQFRGVRGIQRDGKVTVCGEVNAKNGYGGYVGFSPFMAFLDPVSHRVTMTKVAKDDDVTAFQFIATKCV